MGLENIQSSAPEKSDRCLQDFRRSSILLVRLNVRSGLSLPPSHPLQPVPQAAPDTQVLTMPLFFASNAIYPTTIMPAWLKVISHLNPLTYVVDTLRTSMLAGSPSSFGLGLDYAVILVTTVFWS
jgi:hypothetical protein